MKNDRLDVVITKKDEVVMTINPSGAFLDSIKKALRYTSLPKGTENSSKNDTEVPVSLKSDRFAPLKDSIERNITKYNGISETGKPIYVSEDIIAKLRGACEKYHGRVSVRALAQAILDSVINDMDGLKILDDYMKTISYKESSPEKLAHNKALADKAKERRLNRKG